MFITFEGPEGAGKTTLIRALENRLRDEFERVVLVTREPGEGHFGRQIREILLQQEEVTDRAELFLFLADRAHHVETVIKPSLARGEIVLCDRYVDSTVVYQGHARGMDIGFLRNMNAFATDKLRPEITFLLDIDPEIGLVRQVDRDRLGRMPLEFHQRVRRGFLREADLDPERFIILDAERPAPGVEEQAWMFLAERLRS
ncbi:MAG: dTMP kinase [Armatimonadetes bacterium]|nr:dTMP kinase [Armatimonadota bacterium]